MKTRTQLLIDSMSCKMFSVYDVEKLIEISYLEGIGEFDKMNEKVNIFKSKFALKDHEWLQHPQDIRDEKLKNLEI